MIFVDLIQKLFRIFYLGQVVITRSHIRNGKPCFPLKKSNAHKEVISGLIHGINVHIGSRRDDPHHIPLHKPFCKLWILHLFTDSHLISLGDQLVQIAVYRMIRNPAHRRPLFQTTVLPGKRDLKFFGCGKGIFKEHLIEIPQTIKQDTIMVFFFRLQILLHHWCHFSHYLPPVSPLHSKNHDIPLNRPEQSYPQGSYLPENVQWYC